MSRKRKSVLNKAHPTASDITECKQDLNSLPASQEHFQALIENSLDAIAVVNGDGITTYACPSFERLLGWTREDLIGKSPFGFVHEDDMSRVADVFAQLMQDPGSIVHDELRVWHKDGSLRYVEVVGQNLLYNPVVAGIVANLRDITERKWMEVELQKAYDELEIKIEERTSDLIKANEELQIQITDRKRAEEALRGSEEYCRALIENALDVIAVMNSDGIMTYRSPSFEPLLGWTREDQISQSLLSFIHPDDRSRATNHFTELLKMPGGIVHDELRVWHKDGSLRYVEVVGQNLLHNPVVAGIVANFRDISERKQAEEALREHKQEYRTILEDIEDGYYEVDIAGNFTFFNDPMCRIIGYSKDEMMGMNNRQYMDKENAKKVYQAFNRVYTTGKHTKEFGWEIIRKDGTKRFIEASVSLKRNLEGELIGFRGIVRDITDRKQAEETLRHSEEHFRALTENVLDVIVVLNRDGTIRYKSPSFERMMGEERSGKDHFGLVHPDDLPHAFESFAQLMQNPDATLHTEIRGQHRDGSWHTFEVVGKNLLDNPAVGGIVATFRDITESKKAEEEKQRMEQQLQVASRLAAVGELTAGVAHELNNPLAAVQAFAQFLAAREDLDETTRSDVVTIYEEAQRASRITSNLLSFARRHKPDKTLISINQAVEKSLEFHAYRMEVNNIEVLKELDPDLLMTMADFHQMHQVFVNIITNAEQAMTEAHGRGKLFIKTQKVDEMIQINFIDDGPGISEENIKRIFDPFFTTKEVGEGTGLGLSICFGIVQEHGGRLYAKSKPGKGATLVVEIPIISEEQLIGEEATSTHHLQFTPRHL